MLIILFFGLLYPRLLQNTGEEETPLSEEEQQLVNEARAVVERFNGIYIAQSEEEFSRIIEDTWLDAEDVQESMREIFHNAQESGYVDLEISFADESIVIADNEDAFMYKATMFIKITKEDGMYDEYNLEAEYYFKKANDGSYKLEEIKTIDNSTMPK